MFNRCMNTMPEFKIVDLDGKTSQKTQIKDFDLEGKFEKLKPWRQGHDREPNLLSDRGGLHLLVHYRVLPQAGRFFYLASHLLSHCTTAIADTYSSNTKTRCPWEAEVLEGPSQYCRHPGYPALLPIIGIHRGGIQLPATLQTESIGYICAGELVPTRSDRAAVWGWSDNDIIISSCRGGRWGGDQLWRDVQNHSS